MADASQVRQLVWNLVRNAIQASSAGDEVVARVIVDAEGSVLEISDNGPGIPNDAVERLFDAFFTTRAHGAGIGLAVVKQIVDSHGFTVEVDSLGRGTTFRVRMPKASAAPSRDEA
jgi:signal transduction histidine kinase